MAAVLYMSVCQKNFFFDTHKVQTILHFMIFTVIVHGTVILVERRRH